jgi:hypothetical protein
MSTLGGSTNRDYIPTPQSTPPPLQEYLESARQFDVLAAEETKPAIKAQLEEQADAYRKLAERRARFPEAAKPKTF